MHPESEGGKELKPATNARTVAFVFDIDGVLVKGTHPLPWARETLQLLQRLNVPFIFLTNGGGLTEAAHAARLGHRLSMQISPKQFVQSHTPYRDLLATFSDQPILVLGGEGVKIRDVARAYGFKKVIISSDFLVEDPNLHPFSEMTKNSHMAHGRRGEDIEGLNQPLVETSVAAIMVWSSPRDWCLDLQLTLDLLLSVNGLINTRSPKNGDPTLPNRGYLQDGQPQLFFCNPDLEWATQAAQPRLAQGAFREALRGLWSEATGGADLRYTICGKPTELTYQYGEGALKDWNSRHASAEGCLASEDCSKQEREQGQRHGQQQQRLRGHDHKDIGTVYMIGDNPQSDIKGATAYQSRFGYRWKSILVETGVYVSGTVPAHTPTHIAENVKEAVRWALREEGVMEKGRK